LTEIKKLIWVRFEEQRAPEGLH